MWRGARGPHHARGHRATALQRALHPARDDPRVAVGPDDWLFLGQKLADPGSAIAVRWLVARRPWAASRSSSPSRHFLRPRVAPASLHGLPRRVRDLPSPFTPLYGELRQLLVDEGVTVPDLLPALQRADERTYLNNDSHQRPSAHTLRPRSSPGSSRTTCSRTPRLAKREHAFRSTVRPLSGRRPRLGFSKGACSSAGSPTRSPLRCRRCGVAHDDLPGCRRAAADPVRGNEHVHAAVLVREPAHRFPGQGHQHSREPATPRATGCSSVRLWITGARPWPEILVWRS